MGMRFGERLQVTLFGESHGAVVGALLEGMPAGIPFDADLLVSNLRRRRPGAKDLSQRKESDVCEVLSGVYEGCTTGWPILLLVRNHDASSSDYTFLPDHPRPGHADLPESVATAGHADPRGGGSQSGRLTLGLVAAASFTEPLLDGWGWRVVAHLGSVGEIETTPLLDLIDANSSFPAAGPGARLNCLDSTAAEEIQKLIHDLRLQKDSIGSSVDVAILNLPLGFGEPWFEGLEPVLAHGMMAIPGARAVEFGRGVRVSKMRGTEHNDAWGLGPDGPTLSSEGADGALGGRATGAPLLMRVHFKPPSSIPSTQSTLHLPSGELRDLKVGGRHDPVLGPRAAPVVEAVAKLVLTDLGLLSGRYVDE